MRAGRAVTVVVGLAGIALVALASTRAWAYVTVDGVPGMDDVKLDGRTAVPAALPVALASGAMVVVTAMSGRIWRYLVASLLTAAGVFVALTSVQAGLDAAVILERALKAGAGLFGMTVTTGIPADASARADLTAWPWVGAAGGALLALSGLLALVTGHRWPGPAERFERPAPAPAPAEPAADAVHTWDALSRGDDPT